MALRARLARRLATPAAAVVALLLGCYGYFYQAGGWNQNSRFDLVRAMVEDRSLEIDRFAKNTKDTSKRDGHVYCDKAPGASWLCVPTYAAAYWATTGIGRARHDPVWLGWVVWLSILFAIGVPSAIAAVFLARLMRTLGAGPRAAWATALGWGLATMALPYSTLLYGNQSAASFLVIAFALVVEVRHGAAATRGRMIAVGALLGFAIATEYPAMLIALPVAAYALRFIPFRTNLWAAAGGAVPVLALAWYHTAAFGGPLTVPYQYSTWPHPHTGWFMGIGTPDPTALWGILGGAYRGLFYGTPWLLLAVPGAVVWARARHRAELIVCAVAVVLFIWLNASIPPWHGGWAAGPRYLVPMLPFLAVLAGGALVWLWPATPVPGRRRAPVIAATAVVAVLLADSAANMFAATAVRPEIDMKYERPYPQFVWPNFWDGELSVSTQGMDEVTNQPDGPRQAWNLGMKAGLDGHASLVPLLAWLIGCAVWLRRALRRDADQPSGEPTTAPAG